MFVFFLRVSFPKIAQRIAIEIFLAAGLSLFCAAAQETAAMFCGDSSHSGIYRTTAPEALSLKGSSRRAKAFSPRPPF
jgi:hypothetical protein